MYRKTRKTRDGSLSYYCVFLSQLFTRVHANRPLVLVSWKCSFLKRRRSFDALTLAQDDALVGAEMVGGGGWRWVGMG